MRALSLTLLLLVLATSPRVAHAVLLPGDTLCVTGPFCAQLTSDSLPLDKAAHETHEPSRDRRMVPGTWDMITHLPGDWSDWAQATFQLRHWPEAALVTASTAAFIYYDNEVWVPFRKVYVPGTAVHTLADGFVFMGDGKFQFGLAALFAGYGFAAHDGRALRTASQTCEVILAAGGVVQLLKHLTGRESPIVSTTPTGRWQFFPNQIEYAKHVPHYDAFPSGHLTTALATLTVIANNYPEQAWIRPVGYAACAGIALGLVTTSIHWWSDYPLAIALGYGFGSLVSPDPHGDVSVTESPASGKIGVSGLTKLLDQAVIYPAPSPTGMGVGMALRF